MKIPTTLLALILASCASNPPEKEEEEKEESPLVTQTIVGRVASVSKVGKFVLIQKFGPGILPPNQIYQSRGLNNRTASLRPSGERVRDFFAADLLSGSVEKGDAVVAYSEFPKKTDEQDEENPDLPTESEEKPPDSGEDPKES